MCGNEEGRQVRSEWQIPRWTSGWQLRLSKAQLTQDEDEEAIGVPYIPWPLRRATLPRPPPFVQNAYLNEQHARIPLLLVGVSRGKFLWAE